MEAEPEPPESILEKLLSHDHQHLGGSGPPSRPNIWMVEYVRLMSARLPSVIDYWVIRPSEAAAPLNLACSPLLKRLQLLLMLLDQARD